MRTLALFALLIVVAPVSAGADPVYYFVGSGTYSYSGAPFLTASGIYTTADRITGSFTVAEGFVAIPNQGGANFTGGVVSYSWTDGHQTLTEANSTGYFRLNFPVENSGFSYTWRIEITTLGGPGSILTYLEMGEHGDEGFLDAANQGGGNNSGPWAGIHRPGTWTVTTPEPSTLLLLGAGLPAVLALSRWVHA